jgi:hypothetical protein
MANPSHGKFEPWQTEPWQTEPWQSTSSNPQVSAASGINPSTSSGVHEAGATFCDEIETVEAVLSPDLPLR